MTKGNYNVSAADAAQNDVSFRNCVCAMLVFIAMCSLIIVAVIITKAYSPVKSVSSTENSGGEQEELYDNGPIKTPIPTTTTSTTTPKILSTLKARTTKRPDDLTTTTSTTSTTKRATDIPSLVPLDPIGDTVTVISATTVTQKTPPTLKTNTTEKANNTDGLAIGDTSTTTISTSTIAHTTSPTLQANTTEKANISDGLVPIVSDPTRDTQKNTISTTTVTEKTSPTLKTNTTEIANDTDKSVIFVSEPFGGASTTTFSATTVTEEAPLSPDNSTTVKENDRDGLVPPDSDQTRDTQKITIYTTIVTEKTSPTLETNTTERANDTDRLVIFVREPLEDASTTTFFTTIVTEETPLSPENSTTVRANDTDGLVTLDSDPTRDTQKSTTSTTTVTEEIPPALKTNTTEKVHSTDRLVIFVRDPFEDASTTTISLTTVTEEATSFLETNTVSVISVNDVNVRGTTEDIRVGVYTDDTTTVDEASVSVDDDKASLNITLTTEDVPGGGYTEDTTTVEEASVSVDGYKSSLNVTLPTENVYEGKFTDKVTTVKVSGIAVDDVNVTVTTEDIRNGGYTEDITTVEEVSASVTLPIEDVRGGKSTDKITTVEVQSSSSTTEGNSNTDTQVDSEYSPVDDSDEVTDDDGTITNMKKHYSGVTTQETSTATLAEDFTEESNNNISKNSQNQMKEGRSIADDPLNPFNPFNKTICDTDACKMTASRMLSLMDHFGEECVDFYKYSCGGLKTDTQHDHLVDVWSQFYKVMNDGKTSSLAFVDHFKRFYHSCVTHEDTFDYGSRVQAVKDIVEDLGGIILDEQSQVNTTTLTVLLAKLVLRKSLPVMDVNIEVDSKSGQYVFQITLPEKNVEGDPLSDWSTSLSDERRCRSEKNRHRQDPLDLSNLYASLQDCRNDHTSHKAAVENVLQQVNFYSNWTENSVEDEINKNLEDLDEILHLLDNVSGADIQNVMMHEKYTEVNIAKLQTDWDVINWQMFLEELHGDTLPQPQDLVVHVYLYDKIDILMTHFKNMTQGRSRYLYNILLILYATDVYENTVIPKQTDNREQYCLELSTHLYHDISTHVYMNDTKNIKSKYEEDKIGNIFDILIKNFINAIENSGLFQDSKTVVEKARKLQVHFPSNSRECLNEANLNQKYKKAPIFTDEVFGKHLISSIELHHRSLFSLVGKTFDEEDMFCYFLYPYDVEPKTFYAKEVIAVPYGILRTVPRDMPDYALMARVGIHLARGIGMHFNPIGLTHHTNLGMEAGDVYDNFNEIPFTRTRVVNKQNLVFDKSELTMITEVTDNMALRMASDTFKQLQNNFDLLWIRDSFNQEQIFFISVAQEFCQKVDTFEYMLHIYERGVLPAPMRVEMMLVNSKEFASAFDCRDGTIMNTEEVRRKQFPHIIED